MEGKQTVNKMRISLNYVFVNLEFVTLTTFKLFFCVADICEKSTFALMSVLKHFFFVH